MHFGPLEGRRRISSLGGTDQGFVVDLIGAKLSAYIYCKYIYRERGGKYTCIHFDSTLVQTLGEGHSKLAHVGSTQFTCTPKAIPKIAAVASGRTDDWDGPTTGTDDWDRRLGLTTGTDD